MQTFGGLLVHPHAGDLIDPWSGSDPFSETHLPTVAFDTRIGRRLAPGTVIDFDIQGYTDYLRDRGLRRYQISDRTVIVTPRTGSIPGTSDGMHDPEEMTMYVVLPRFRQEKRANTALIHETEHAIQDALDQVDNRSKVQTIASNILKLLSLPTLFATNAVITAERLLFQRTPDTITTSVWGTSIAMFVAYLAVYFSNSTEIRAFKAQRIYRDLGFY